MKKWLKNNISFYDLCLPIAPEENFILFELTSLIEKNGVQVVGSSSNAVNICSDKFLTYQALKEKVPVVPTRKVLWEQIDEYANGISDRYVVKPVDGVSCLAVQVVDSAESFRDAAMHVKNVTNLPYFLLQDYVEGASASVSLLTNGKRAIPLSLNKQYNTQNNGSIIYDGGKVPMNHSKENEAKKIAKKAVESIKGLKGYVGVDLILGDEVYLVEINSRITTPYVALRQMLNFNLGEAIVESVKGHLPEEVNIKGEIEFQKEADNLQLKVID
ncbi:ATP-grasp domain-containing protein [Methanobacterium petrolearium]|uniref:ATP-grasp domain-containing protein n=1 Tax=Methanobacterium petrolearium TaxID=710190 RepID=UPI00308197E6|nr:hypothetical protein GCM10025861_15740 [Methanobacterium petrolearium]